MVDTECISNCILCHNHFMPTDVKKAVPIKSFNTDDVTWTHYIGKFCK